jgi:hypothetical protein
MGRWCEVKCNCLKRTPLPGSDWFDYRSYLKFGPPPLVKTEEEWDQKVRGMYECGHRKGILLEFWPGDLFAIGDALEIAYKHEPNEFEIFKRISNWNNYEDECLPLSLDEVTLWQLEIELLQRYLTGEEYMEWHHKQTFDKEIGLDTLLYGDVPATLEDGLRLCRASIEIGNPIEFFL